MDAVAYYEYVPDLYNRNWGDTEQYFYVFMDIKEWKKRYVLLWSIKYTLNAM